MSSPLDEREKNHIKTSFSRCDAEELASELGRSVQTVRKYIKKIKEAERITKIAGGL